MCWCPLALTQCARDVSPICLSWVCFSLLSVMHMAAFNMTFLDFVAYFCFAHGMPILPQLFFLGGINQSLYCFMNVLLPRASRCSLSSIKAVHWLRWDCFSSGCLPAGYPLSTMLPSVCKTLRLPVHLMNIVLTASLPITLLLCTWKAGQFIQCDNLFIYSSPLCPFCHHFPFFKLTIGSAEASSMFFLCIDDAVENQTLRHPLCNPLLLMVE